MTEETFVDINIAEINKEYSLIHGTNINLARVIPAITDGLKPVQRRLLYIMFLRDQGRSFRKVAAISGDTIARLHHHGNTAVEEAIVRLGQTWNNIIPLIEKMGNYGSVSGDEAAAPRYIQARISDYAFDCFFREWKESSVDMITGADGETKEPSYLPSRYPNILLNGSLGIGYSIATNIPPYSLKEVIETTIALMKNPLVDFILIPDSPSGCDILTGNFKKICETGNGIYSMRCKYEIDTERNMIKIIALPLQVTGNDVRQRIAEIKDSGGLNELTNMEDYSGERIDLRLYIRHDVHPHKFIKKLIDSVSGLERSYPVNIVVVEAHKSYDLSIRQLLLEWIRYRREQKRTIINHKRTTLLAEQRTNDVKIFIMQGTNLEDTIQIFRSSRNRMEIEDRLIERYFDSPIRMDSLQAKTLSELRMHELSKDAYDKSFKRQEEIEKELKGVIEILNAVDGIDKVIIGELRDGIKRYGKERRSNVIPHKISLETEVAGECVLQLSVDGYVLRKQSTNIEADPLPIDPGGFAVRVENDSSFIAVDEKGLFSFIKVKELPVDLEVPLSRFIKEKLGRIIALLPYDLNSDYCCTLISAQGMLKKFPISEMKPAKKPCIELSKDDHLVNGIVSGKTTRKNILVYTKEGYGNVIDPNSIRITSYTARGTNGFQLTEGDRIIGCYLINMNKEYLLYVTSRGKMRKNLTQFLLVRKSKGDEMVRLITLADRDSLLAVLGCDRNDQVEVFYQNHAKETVDLSKLPEGTMSELPVKMVEANMVSTRIIKVKLF